MANRYDLIRREQQTRARLDYALRRSTEEAYTMVLHLVPELIEALGEAGDDVIHQQVMLVEAMRDDLRSMRSSLLTTHEDVALAVKNATVASYRSTLAASERPQGYRAGANSNDYKRYANGVLGAALNDKTIVRATYDGIAFPNIGLLDRRAAQWHRLNFGTGAGTANRQYSAAFGGMVISGLGMVGEGPSRPFRIPAGIWVNSEFYPRREAGNAPPGPAAVQEQRPASAVKAWNFLDAGIQTLVNLLPVAYGTQFGKLMAQRGKGRGAFSRVTTVVLHAGPTDFAGQVFDNLKK